MVFFVSVVLNVVLIIALLQTRKLARVKVIEDESKYPFLSHRIFFENPNDIVINFVKLRTNLNNYVNQSPDFIGMYFEYLPSGTSIGINDKEEVRLASLGKVTTVMAVHKQAQEGKLRMTETATIKKEHLDKQFGDLWRLGEGATVTIEKAARLALTDSDNTAHNLLLSRLPGPAIVDIYNGLDIPTNSNNVFPVISAKNYSSILRSLYLSSYLSKERSNQILGLITQTKFTDKLPAGVPNHIKVAHKVGVTEKKDQAESTFSDCGIVYIPKRPYILCMIVKGSNETAQKHMKELSKTVYDYVSQINTD